MPSPFPGMNPYLEQEGIWHDFHASFVPVLRDALAEQLLPRYIISVEEHVYVHAREAPRVFAGRPDVAVKPSLRVPLARESTAVLDAPMQLELSEPADVFTEPYLEIRDRADELVVTVIELLSPANKRLGADREQYLSKRQRYLHSSANFVELDFLRGGERMPTENLPACDYYVLVRRVEDRNRVGLWPLRLRDRLPIIPVPVQAPDPDARIDLQKLLDLVYDRAGYRYRIYQGTPRPGLSRDDSQWAEEIAARESGAS